jgi:hypothetical protein
MTKPNFVNHSTTGMFNYVVKDPDSSGLSREFWIKDQAGSIPKDGLPCVLELDCAVVYVDWPLRISLTQGLTQPACDPDYGS